VNPCNVLPQPVHKCAGGRELVSVLLGARVRCSHFNYTVNARYRSQGSLSGCQQCQYKVSVCRKVHVRPVLLRVLAQARDDISLMWMHRKHVAGGASSTCWHNAHSRPSTSVCLLRYVHVILSTWHCVHVCSILRTSCVLCLNSCTRPSTYSQRSLFWN
jgi:hypothetical protein